MFFCRRRRSIWSVLLLLLGFRWIKKERMTEDERNEYRAKARLFRTKLREAYAVWDTDESQTTEEN